MRYNKILFRADGGSNIGLGHIFRSLSLLQMLQNDFDCVFVTASGVEIQKIIGNYTNRVEVLKPDDTHFEQFLSLLKGDEIVVLDNYFFNSEYQKKIKDKGCKLVCINDIPDLHFYADLIINHSLSVSEDQYSKEDYSKCLLGLDYVLLSQEFLKLSEIRRVEEMSFFVCFGGADPLDLTSKTVDQLLKLPVSGEINVVVGSMYNTDKLQYLERLCDSGKINLTIGASRSRLIEIMLQSNIGIVPSSGILLECLATGMKVITGYYVDNQKEITASFSDKKIGAVVGDIRQLNITQELLNEVAAIDFDKSLIDGKSGERLLNEFKLLANGD